MHIKYMKINDIRYVDWPVKINYLILIIDVAENARKPLRRIDEWTNYRKSVYGFRYHDPVAVFGVILFLVSSRPGFLSVHSPRFHSEKFGVVLVHFVIELNGTDVDDFYFWIWVQRQPREIKKIF